MEGISNDLVAAVGGMDIRRTMAHPGIGADMCIGNVDPTEGVKDVDNGTITLYIAGKMLIQCEREGELSGTNILIGIVVVHNQQIAGGATPHCQSGVELWQNNLPQTGVEDSQVTLILRQVDHA